MFTSFTLVGMHILPARLGFELFFPLGNMLLGPFKALTQGFVPAYGFSRFSSLWSSDKVLFIVFIYPIICYCMRLFL